MRCNQQSIDLPGGNVGIFTLQAASIVGATGRIVAVEALPPTFSYLQQNVMADHRVRGTESSAPCTKTQISCDVDLQPVLQPTRVQHACAPFASCRISTCGTKGVPDESAHALCSGVTPASSQAFACLSHCRIHAMDIASA
jgi:hypothetical protein